MVVQIAFCFCFLFFSGGLIYLLDLFCNGTNPTVRERSAELFSKMMSDKLIGPKVKIVLSKFLPTIFMEAMRDSAAASVHMFEGDCHANFKRLCNAYFRFCVGDSVTLCMNCLRCRQFSNRHPMKNGKARSVCVFVRILVL